jgi:hypothetical protein
VPERIFTPNNIRRIQRMAEEGCSAIEIAQSIGSTPASVRVMCCRNKIKIFRRRRSIANGLVVHLPASVSSEFYRKAELLQIPASALAAKLLSAIVVSNIYEAVLDEKDESHPALALAA